MQRITNHIPNAITCCNLLSGCIAVYMAFHLTETLGPLTGEQWFYICIGAAAIFDFCDGLAARSLKAYSLLGKELDSLSDLVSFGVAPGMLILNIMLQYTPQPYHWACFIAMLIPVMGALRLAKFNIDDTQSTTFRGLPIPANAIFWIGLSAWIERYMFPGYWVMAAVIVAISLSMLGNFKMFSLKFKNLAFIDNIKRYTIILATVAFVVFYGVSGLVWTIILYFLMSLLSKNN